MRSILEKRACLVAAFVLYLTGARLALHADGRSENAFPPMRALGRDIPVGKYAVAPETPTAYAQSQESDGVLTLPQALELALRHSPELTASAHAVLAAEGNVRQAGVFRNPELELVAGDFGGSGASKGYPAESSVSLSQPVELGGKRGKRLLVAESEARLAGWGYEAKRLELIAMTSKAFVDVLLEQGRLALTESLLKLAEDVRKAAAERVKAGKVPFLEETKAGVEVAIARIARDRARRELETARKRLASSWGGTLPVFKEASGELDVIREIPPMDKLGLLLEDSPEVARGKEEMALGGKILDLAKAERIPDIVVSAGLSRFEEDDTQGGSVGISVALPLFDRKAGGILAARHHAVRVEYEQRAARLRATTELGEAYGELETARAEALAIKTELIPGAQQAFDAAQTGFKDGKSGYLEVLDAQRTLSEAKSRHLEVLADYHKAAADVESLIGTSLIAIQ